MSATFKITAPGDYVSRDGTKMRVLVFHEGSGYWFGKYAGTDPLVGLAWRADGTRGAPGIDDPLDLVSPATTEGGPRDGE